ncbi:hypothetical protein ACWEP5_36515 [Nocardia niigatensis]
MSLKSLLGSDTTVTIDLSRRPNDRERKQFDKRRTRLEKAYKSRATAIANAQSLVTAGQLETVRIRTGFIRLDSPMVDDASDRSAPPPEHRPPSTRLMNPNGIALRLMLIALLEAQTRTAPGARAHGTPIPLRGHSSAEMAWTRLFSTPAEASGAGKSRMSITDKQWRQLQTTLARLEAEGLIEPEKPDIKSGRYEGFFLLREDVRRGAVADPYNVPDDEPYFEVPVSLFTRGWIHVLEDSELALLLITAYLRHRYGGELQAVPAGTRLLHYGLGRDAFEAHIMLSRLKLIDVAEDVDRNPNGKVTDYAKNGAQPHALLFLPGGLDRDAGTAVRGQLDYQLSR